MRKYTKHAVNLLERFGKKSQLANQDKNFIQLREMQTALFDFVIGEITEMVIENNEIIKLKARTHGENFYLDLVAYHFSFNVLGIEHYLNFRAQKVVLNEAWVCETDPNFWDRKFSYYKKYFPEI